MDARPGQGARREEEVKDPEDNALQKPGVTGMRPNIANVEPRTSTPPKHVDADDGDSRPERPSLPTQLPKRPVRVKATGSNTGGAVVRYPRAP
jgi:hypothetical protein